MTMTTSMMDRAMTTTSMTTIPIMIIMMTKSMTIATAGMEDTEGMGMNMAR